jgi:hypothetical protein
MNFAPNGVYRGQRFSDTGARALALRFIESPLAFATFALTSKTGSPHVGTLHSQSRNKKGRKRFDPLRPLNFGVFE